MARLCLGVAALHGCGPYRRPAVNAISTLNSLGLRPYAMSTVKEGEPALLWPGC